MKTQTKRVRNGMCMKESEPKKQIDRHFLANYIVDSSFLVIELDKVHFQTRSEWNESKKYQNHMKLEEVSFFSFRLIFSHFVTRVLSVYGCPEIWSHFNAKKFLSYPYKCGHTIMYGLSLSGCCVFFSFICSSENVDDDALQLHIKALILSFFRLVLILEH